jgi:hypothetical protein
MIIIEAAQNGNSWRNYITLAEFPVILCRQSAGRAVLIWGKYTTTSEVLVELAILRARRLDDGPDGFKTSLLQGGVLRSKP